MRASWICDVLFSPELELYYINKGIRLFATTLPPPLPGRFVLMLPGHYYMDHNLIYIRCRTNRPSANTLPVYMASFVFNHLMTRLASPSPVHPSITWRPPRVAYRSSRDASFSEWPLQASRRGLVTSLIACARAQLLRRSAGACCRLDSFSCWSRTAFWTNVWIVVLATLVCATLPACLWDLLGPRDSLSHHPRGAQLWSEVCWVSYWPFTQYKICQIS